MAGIVLDDVCIDVSLLVTIYFRIEFDFSTSRAVKVLLYLSQYNCHLFLFFFIDSIFSSSSYLKNQLQG